MAFCWCALYWRRSPIGGEPPTSRNLCKLGAWQAGSTAAYQEGAVRVAFEEGQDAMRRHLEELLAPILYGRVS